MWANAQVVAVAGPTDTRVADVGADALSLWIEPRRVAGCVGTRRRCFATRCRSWMKCVARAGVHVSTTRDGRRYRNAVIFSLTRLVVFSPREAPPARPSPPNACRQTTRRAPEVRMVRARASPRPATATTGAFCSIGDEAGERMVARATDHRRRARSRSSRASSLTSSSQTENRDLNKRTAESEASPPSARPATAPYRPSHEFCRPRGTSKPCRVGGVHFLSVRLTLENPK